MKCTLRVVTPLVEGKFHPHLQRICTTAIEVGGLITQRKLAPEDLLPKIDMTLVEKCNRLDRQLKLAPELGVGGQADNVALLGERLGRDLIPFLVDFGVSVRVRIA